MESGLLVPTKSRMSQPVNIAEESEDEEDNSFILLTKWNQDNGHWCQLYKEVAETGSFDITLKEESHVNGVTISCDQVYKESAEANIPEDKSKEDRYDSEIVSLISVDNMTVEKQNDTGLLVADDLSISLAAGSDAK